MIDLNKYASKDFSLVVITAFFIQCILGIQGFDVCDDGFVLTSYQQMFHAPASVEYNFVYYLSGVVGGLWHELFPKGGLLWFRFFTVIINTLKFCIAWQLLKNVMPKRLALVSCLMLLFINNYGFLTFYHNYLTEVLLLSSLYFLMNYFRTEKLFYAFLFAAITSINVFSRVTNITLFALFLCIPFFDYLKTHSFKNTSKPLMAALLGTFSGFGFILLLLLSFGHFDIMKRALLSLVDLGNTEGSSHNVFSLLNIYYYDATQIVIYSLFICIICTLFLAVYNKISSRKYLRTMAGVFFFLIFSYFFKKPQIHFIYAAGCLGSLAVLIISSYNHLTKVMAFAGLVILTVLPIGSGGGISSSGYMCLWLSLPFFVYALYNSGPVSLGIESSSTKKIWVFTATSFKVLTLLICSSFLVSKAYHISKQAYFDPGNRLEKTHAIKSNLAKGVFTTQRRAQIINELLPELKKHVQPKDYLLVYDKVPMLHFLTETRPYMYNPWVWIYDETSFEKKLTLAEKEIKTYPVVVVQKFETIFSFSDPIPNYLTTDPDNPENVNAAKNKLLLNYLHKNKYHVVWSNAYFNIYKTDKKHL